MPSDASSDSLSPRRAKVIDVQPTPNPNAMKFVLDHPISDHPISFFTGAAAKDHPLAKSLFAIEGVTNVLVLGDFVTVGKSPQARWGELTPRIRRLLSGD